MNFYEREMRMMFGDSDIIQNPHFVGRTMIGKLGEDLRIKMEFIATEVHQRYDAILATVINRTGGAVDKQTFRFSDIIGKQRTRANDLVCPHMCQYGNEPEWRPVISASQKAQIADSVLTYVEMYQDQTMEMGEMKM